jgi:glyoxylase-like metal-dependent hydrolase (beta-lactamase superfamily II)
MFLLASVLLFSPIIAAAQDSRAALEAVSKALGATGLKSIEIQGGGTVFQVGQSYTAGTAWPQFNVRSFTRVVNYDTASLRDDLLRTRALEPPKGGGPYVRGEHRQVFVLSGDHAWNVMGEAATPAPITLADRQFQLWSTPHGVVKAALAGKGTMQGRTIVFGVPGSFKATATVDAANLVERVEATMTNPVLGDMPVTVSYADYRDFGGVKFPTKIRQSYGGFPALELTVTEVKPNAAADIPVPDAVRQATNPYVRVQSQKAADGVWYVTGGTHHSVVIEMKDHVIVVESPLNDERAGAVLAETRKLVPGKPIRYIVNSHHHFDHAGGLRAVAAEGITVITHESSRAFLEQALAAPATMTPDRQAKAGRKPLVEGVRDRRTLTDGTRTVEIYHIAGSTHCDGLLMVYLRKERLLVEADVYTPGPPNAPPPTAVNPLSVHLADTITRLGLAVDQFLPLHGRIVPMADLNKAIGR